jgi:hypothetical protein
VVGVKRLLLGRCEAKETDLFAIGACAWGKRGPYLVTWGGSGGHVDRAKAGRGIGHAGTTIISGDAVRWHRLREGRCAWVGGRSGCVVSRAAPIPSRAESVAGAGSTVVHYMRLRDGMCSERLTEEANQSGLEDTRTGREARGCFG